MSGIIPSSLSPQIPPINHSLPLSAMNNSISRFGVRLKWLMSSQCPCMYGGAINGSPDHNCLSCFGRGIIWTDPGAIFTGLITYEKFGSRSPGYQNDPQWGSLLSSDPNLTIPSTSDAISVWNNASIYDAYIEVDASVRLYSNLSVGGINVVPYQHSLNIADTGAVSIWNTQTKTRELVNTYTVDGPTVTLSGYPDGTNYTVEFTASPVYVSINRMGGMPHVRPFGDGGANYPKRFKLKLLDLWLREATATTSI